MSIATYYDNLNIERAIDDLRRGMFVLISIGTDNFLVAATEEVSSELVDLLSALGGNNGRVKYLLDMESITIKLSVSGKEIIEIQKLCGLYDWSDLSINANDLVSITKKEQFALDLIMYTELLPSVLVYDVDIFINAND